MVRSQETNDENGQFQNARFISAFEAPWRQLQVKITDKNSPVFRLDAYLEIQHRVPSRKARGLSNLTTKTRNESDRIFRVKLQAARRSSHPLYKFPF